MAEYFGLDEEIVELLRNEGYTFTEIEEMLYDPELLDACLSEALHGRAVPERWQYQW